MEERRVNKAPHYLSCALYGVYLLFFMIAAKVVSHPHTVAVIACQKVHSAAMENRLRLLHLEEHSIVTKQQGSSVSAYINGAQLASTSCC